MNDATAAPGLDQPALDGEALRERLFASFRLPVSTYRLQLHAGFTLRDAREIVAYLARLGITDCYCSPYFRALPGSTHGYDVCDFNQLNPELGSEADFGAFVTELAEHSMGHLLDFVPNHMATDPMENRWWRDILQHGQASPFARFFDIDWRPVKPELRDKVLLPFLGDHYGRVLEGGELRVAFSEGELVLLCGDAGLPVDPRLYPRVLRIDLEALQAELGEVDNALQEFLSILTALSHLPPATETKPERVAERLRESRLARERLAKLVTEAPRIRRHVDDALEKINGLPGRPESFDALHEFLEAQSFRLAYWKTAVHEINFRRFFDINQLAGLRMEDAAVFAATHRLVLRLVREGHVTGLRLDHLDGLFDPAGYLEALQTAILEARAAEYFGWGEDRQESQREQLISWRAVERDRDPASVAARPLYVVAEKILSGSEALPEIWPVHGTTGYDYLNDLNRIFVDPRNARAMRQIYERFTHRSLAFSDVVYECKRLITGTSLASELNVLGSALNRISEGDRRARDFTLDSLRQALREVAACFPVYRTYVTAAGATDADRSVIGRAIDRARRRNPAMEASVFEFVREALLPDREKLPEAEYRSRLRFAMKFQQYTGPLQAKGVEDTAFYRYNVLVSLNEVGGDPQRFGGTMAQFHDANQRRVDRSPWTMLATTTHDTKRGEDARARLNVLSELPGEWRHCLSRWVRLNRRNRTIVEGEPAPDRNAEYLFYQALLASWPAEPLGTTHSSAPAELSQRLRDYMLKAVKEAKIHTSWISPNEAYDRAVADFVERTLGGPTAARFLAEFLPFQQRIAQLGVINSLGQVVLKIVAPGVPDFYQGTELWNLSLVDPDNRRPVDYALRQRLLAELEPLLDLERPGRSPQHPAVMSDMLDHWEDGRIKLFITACGLRLRRRFPALFLEGEYRPLDAKGERADHVIALGRLHEGTASLAVVPRFSSRLTSAGAPVRVTPESWQATFLSLPAEWNRLSFTNIFTHEAMKPVTLDGDVGVPVGDVLAGCPVAILLAVSH
jgi:(1->4)-alpha-D-glucan 1-alpha-D-glucosylmutase